jgi:hypothetical protein
MKILEDARNIFKSSVIQFAVQERTLRRYIVVLNHEG